MTPAQVRRNPYAREAALLRRIERQERVETVLYRSLLVILAVGGTWLLWWKDSYAGWRALPSDIFIIGTYLGFIAIKFRDDFRN